MRLSGRVQMRWNRSGNRARKRMNRRAIVVVVEMPAVDG